MTAFSPGDEVRIARPDPVHERLWGRTGTVVRIARSTIVIVMVGSTRVLARSRELERV